MNPRRAFLKRLIKAACVAPLMRITTRGATTFSSGRAYYQGTVPVTAPPFTMACWFNSPNITGEYIMMSIGDFNTNNYHFLNAAGHVAGDFVRASSRDNSSLRHAATSAAFSANTWTHACGVWTSDSSRTAYINGGNSGTDTNSVAPTDIDYIAICGIRVSNAWYGVSAQSVAECAIWNVALSADDVTALARGYRPSLIRPSALVFYAPIVRDITDVRGGLSLTVSGNSTAVHPRRIG